MIKVENLNVYYNSFEVVNSVDLEIYNQDYLVIIGENGSGKSSLIKALLGLNKNISGTIQIDGVDIKDYNKWEQFGYVAQKNVITHDIPITVQEYLTLYSQDDVSLKKLIKKFEIENLLNKKLNDLSGGQFQKINIVKALSKNIKYLILDEPDNSLDKLSKGEIYRILEQLNNQGLTVVVVSHNVDGIEGKKRVYNMLSKEIETIC